MDKKHKMIIRIVLISLGIVGLIGLALFAASQFISSTPLMISGLIIAGIGFVPFLIISIILFIKHANIR